jgi:short-subunit dehydrogenase
MAQRGRGGIIFLSSIVAYQGTPFSGNYAASKAYDLHLAEALAYELKGQGVDVLAVSPGPTATEGTADLDMSVLPLPVLSVGPVVANALRNLGRRSATIPGVMNNLMNLVGKLGIPRTLNTRMMGYLFGQMVSGRSAGAGGAAQNPLTQQES